MAEFSSLDNSGQTIPTDGASVSPMELTTPNSIITGTSAGLQALGAQNIRTDAINKRIVVNDGITNRVSFGKIGTGVNDWGLKVSQPNMNVDTATASQLIFNSTQDMFKIVTKLTGSIPSFSYSNSFGRTSITIPHGQSFTPILQIYVQGALLNSSLGLIASSYVPLPISPGGSNITGKYYFSNGASNYYSLGIAFAVDSTNITIQAETNGSQSGSDTIAAIPYTIFVLQETAT